MVKRTIKDFKRFMTERRLTSSFNKWNNIKNVPKQTVEVSFNTYTGHSKRSKLYVYRRGNRTIFKDFNTLNTLGSSKSKVPDAIKKLRTISKVRHKKQSFNGKRIDFDIKRSGIKLKNSNSRFSYNQSENKLREVVSTNTKKGKRLGAVVTRLELTSGSGSKFRMTIRSRFVPLTSSITNTLIDENIRNAAGKAGWSPFEIAIHDIWYEYWIDRKEKLTKIR